MIAQLLESMTAGYLCSSAAAGSGGRGCGGAAFSGFIESGAGVAFSMAGMLLRRR